VREKARTAQERELPNSANCPTAQTAQERQVPNGDNGADIERREVPNGAAKERNGRRRPRGRIRSDNLRVARDCPNFCV